MLERREKNDAQLKHEEKVFGKQSQINEYDPGPVEGPDGQPLQDNQCICGDFDCNESYSHWTSGF
jgi:hypothetical protein